MPDDTLLTVTVTLSNRVAMNSATSRIDDPWTYHHVQPVRVYFAIAATILQVITHPDCWRSARSRGLEALLLMNPSGANKNALRSLVARRSNGFPLTEAEVTDAAKRCASPRWGGFAGPNPVCRTDDPRDAPEPTRPLSKSLVWWEAVARLRSNLLSSFGINDLLVGPQTLATTKPVFDWCPVVIAWGNDCDLAEQGAIDSISWEDWLVEDATSIARPWTKAPGTSPDQATVAQLTEKLRLRLPFERKAYVVFSAVNRAEARPRSPVFMKQCRVDRTNDCLRPIPVPP